MVYINGVKAPEAFDGMISDLEREEEIKYAVCMLRLQSRAGLTFKEARAYMCPHYEVLETIVIEYGITMQAAYNLARRARNKVAAAGLDEDLFGKFRMTMMYDPA